MRNKTLSILFLLITFLIGFNIIVVKDKTVFSVIENRNLSQIEQMSVEAWTTVSFQKSVENTISDHFMAREYFVKAHNTINFTLDGLMKALGGVAFGLSFDDQVEVSMINENINLLVINGEKRLVRSSSEYSEEAKDFLKRKIGLLNHYSRKYSDVEFFSYFIISPHHSALVYPKGNLDSLMPIIETIEYPIGFFKIETVDDIKENFFVTDHHWNHIGSYKGYLEIAELMLVDKEQILVPEDLVCFEDIKFWGSHSRSIAHSVEIEPDSICKYIFDLPQYLLYVNGEKQSNYRNLEDYLSGLVLEKDEKGFDHYNHINQSRKSVIKIDTDRENLDNLLVISDSMSNPIRELIAAHFNDSIFINLDLYNREIGEFSLNKYIKDNNIDKVLIFLSMDNLFPGGEIKHLN